MQDYSAALQSQQRALAIRIKSFGEEHESTADIYRELGLTQRKIMQDYSAALQSHQRALGGGRWDFRFYGFGHFLGRFFGFFFRFLAYGFRFFGNNRAG